MCFVNCHFAAHLEAVNRRNADFDHVYRTMTFTRQSQGLNAANGMVLCLRWFCSFIVVCIQLCSLIYACGKLCIHVGGYCSTRASTECANVFSLVVYLVFLILFGAAGASSALQMFRGPNVSSTFFILKSLT